MEQNIWKLQQTRLRAKEKGFTLVELAIVLVIIGLIIGGVLVGQDLIKAAEIRAQISQIESYNAAVNTFRTRFNGLPGDIRNITSFYSSTSFADIRNGNGNKQLEQCDTAGATCGTYAAAGAYEAVDGAIFTGEIVQFWHHLSAAELIGGSFNGLGYVAATNGATINFAFPASKLDRNGIGVYASGGKNYYQIGILSGADAPTTGEYRIAPSLTPEESFNIDSKVDDGRPGTGSIVVRGSQLDNVVNANLAAADYSAAATACILEAANTPALLRVATYNLANTGIVCSIRLRMN
jgi:prepilin-type N-terminal cleavage/methylation domain-containing protein